MPAQRSYKRKQTKTSGRPAKRKATGTYRPGPYRASTNFPVKKYGKAPFSRKSIHPELNAWDIMNKAPFSTLAGPTFLPSPMYKGARVPLMLESSHTPVIRTVTGSTVTSAETGNACVVIGPALNTNFYNESGTTLTETDHGIITAQAHPEYDSYSELSTNGARFRVLGLSVKLTYIGSQLNRQGQIAVLYSPVTGSGVPTDYSQWENANHSSSFHSAHKDIICISKLYNHPDFINMSSSEGILNMNSIAIALTGVPGNSYKITTRMFVEVVPRTESTFADNARVPTYTGVAPPLHNKTTSTMEITV